MSTELLLKEYLHKLKLPAVARHYKSLARTAAENNRTYEEYLCALLEQEVLSREESALKNRIRRANFPYFKTLEEFDFTALPSLSKPKVLTLSRGEYIKAKENVIFLGNSGTGKTHLAIALALCACRQGYRVRFYTAPGLVTELLAAAREHKLLSLEKQWLKQDLVVVDELGYVPYTTEGAQLLFRFLAGRYERGSVLITSNLEFSEWVQVFGDERMTAALLDRLTHHAHILVMNGESYRFRQSLRRRQEEGLVSSASA
ncbi:MAG: IS21-like element helper ATPase IstB [Thermanaeromonas sp.]|uniref:DNA replication protein DnaC n=1 Tax=Thermanaeromonas toyohensis ToBE TaxID=698762 RepID=A0A1W1VWT8_9FIRM|nr:MULTISPECIES: IS21-like element helper ATPase IstB [Thermanaeromonas]MCG0278933.1 IS21-like element helper ATPase IstB [Thermanaeromonas sp.]SMB97798.1 DNA replication protein DnaC [Thermanaeromonas toyohensis ToBE]